MTQPGSACALSFIYVGHYQSNAEQNNSDVIAFFSFIALTARYNSFSHQQQQLFGELKPLLSKNSSNK